MKYKKTVIILSILCFAAACFISGIDSYADFSGGDTAKTGSVAGSESSTENEKDISLSDSRNAADEKQGLVSLKRKLKKELSGRSGSWSVYVKRLDTNEYMLINDRRLPSASLIKLYVMMTVFNEQKEGTLKRSSIINDRLKKMITVSDNEAANSLTTALSKNNTFKAGTKRINSYCKENGYTKTRFLVSMGKSSPKNVTSARDCGTALERMYRNTCVDRKSSKKMIKLLKAQTRRNKIPFGLPKKVVTANKNGETYFSENDAAIVYSKGADYVIVVMSKNGRDSIAEIRRLSRIVYDYFN